MQLIKNISIFFCCIAMAQVVQAKHAIIIDAGSSGSRIHLYENTNTGIKEVLIPDSKIKPGLSSYQNDPEKAAKSLHALYKKALDVIKAQKLDTNIDMYLFATAGMRALPLDAQNKIYRAIQEDAEKNVPFTVVEARTLQGYEEALFDWLAVNELKGNFNKDGTTTGAIEMGGASLQIAYAVSDKEVSSKIKAVTVRNKDYHIFAHSFLGLGADKYQTQVEMSHCYPNGYQNNARFNAHACKATMANLIEQYKINDINLPKETKFVAFSNFNHTFKFFTPVNSATMLPLLSGGVCEQSWDTFKKIYQGIPEKYLKIYCANGFYQSLLFDKLFGFKSNTQQVTVTNEINGTEINWPIGAALYVSGS